VTVSHLEISSKLRDPRVNFQDSDSTSVIQEWTSSHWTSLEMEAAYYPITCKKDLTDHVKSKGSGHKSQQQEHAHLYSMAFGTSVFP